MSPRKNRRLLEAALILALLAIMLLALMATVDGSVAVVIARPL